MKKDFKRTQCLSCFFRCIISFFLPHSITEFTFTLDILELIEVSNWCVQVWCFRFYIQRRDPRCFTRKYHWRWYTQGSILSIQESTIVHRKLNAKPVSNTTDHVYCQHIGQLNKWGKFNKQIRWNPNIRILIH